MPRDPEHDPPRDPPQVPPPPGFGTPTELADDEVGDECGAEQVLTRDTQVEGLTYLGDYPDLEGYLRAQLEDQVSAACSWILDCLDYAAVQRRFERDGSRLVCESGRVYALRDSTSGGGGVWGRAKP